MAPLPVEVLAGVYLGLLIGIVPALAAWSLGFLFKYFTGVTVPGFAVIVFAAAIAGVNGGLLALLDPTITQSANATTVVTALVVVLMMALYAHNRGDGMGATFPRRLSLRGLRERTLSTDVIDFVGGRHQATVRVVGEVADVEGYPPLPEDLRAEIRGSEWEFPADLRLSELEERLADRLRTSFDLGDVGVTIDEKGRASVVAAPPFSGLSKRVGDGRRAVSVDAVLPTGLARGDEVTVITTDAQVRGIVVSAKTGTGASPAEQPPEPRFADDGAEGTSGVGEDGDGEDGDDEADPDAAAAPVRAPTTTGGDGRLTVSVTRTDAEPIVRADRARVVVESRGTRREYELISMLRRAGNRFRRVTVGSESPLDGTTLAEAAVRDAHDVAVFAVKTAEGWRVAPQGDARLAAGDELFAVGSRSALSAFEEANA